MKILEKLVLVLIPLFTAIFITIVILITIKRLHA